MNLAACGKQQSGDTADSTDTSDGPELVYVPEFAELEGGESIDGNRVCFVGDDLYYMSYNWDMETKTLLSMTLNRYSVPVGTTAEIAVFSLPEYINMTDWTIGGDGSLYVEYVLDENGEPMLDEQGDPVVKPQSTHHSASYGDWTYEYRVPTQEEVDMLLELIKAARLSAESNEPIMTIIGEDAEAFLQGQKSVDEVTETIQRRASILCEREQLNN